MPPPCDVPLPPGVFLIQQAQKVLTVSDALAGLLVESRANYDWPQGTGAARSQQRILDLEAQAADWTARLDPSTAHALIHKVSVWGGNNAKAQAAIDRACALAKTDMLTAIQSVMDPATLAAGLDLLSNLPGLRLVMATKVYRFCCPSAGAAVDRHTSYFFNSLDVTAPDCTLGKAVAFKREWATAGHATSRLAIYSPRGHNWNRDEYRCRYLPLLSQIAESLNREGLRYRCAATGGGKAWRPTDVEMAAYYWWARNGPR